MTFTFSLKQGKPRTSSGPIWVPLIHDKDIKLPRQDDRKAIEFALKFARGEDSRILNDKLHMDKAKKLLNNR